MRKPLNRPYEVNILAEIQRMQISFVVNGRRIDIAIEPQVLLLDLLRDRLALKGAKRSCDMQVCGACTVLVDGNPVSSCTFLAFEARGTEVTTIEGLAVGEKLHPLMDAFIDNAGLQCGFCTPGMILAAKSLLDLNPDPTVEQVKEYMRGNLCRCTGYKKILESIEDAAQRMRD